MKTMWAFTGHGPIIPEVAFLIPPSPIKELRCIASPCFRSRISCFSRSGQSSFYAYILLEISLRQLQLIILISYLQNHLLSFWNGLIIDSHNCNLDELNFGRP